MTLEQIAALEELEKLLDDQHWYLVNFNCEKRISKIPTLNKFNALENTVLTFKPTKQRAVKIETMEFIASFRNHAKELLQLAREAVASREIFKNFSTIYGHVDNCHVCEGCEVSDISRAHLERYKKS